MLQSLRNSTRHPITKILLGLVLIAFAFLGLGSFLPSMQMKSNFISAGKTEVSINQIANEFNKFRNQLMPNKSPVEALDLGLLDIIIQFLSQEALILEEARVLGLTVSRDVQKQSLLETEIFQNVDGVFDPSKFRTVLLQNGLSEDQYLDLIKKNILKQQLINTISSSAKYPETLLKLIGKYNLEKRDVTIIDVPKIENIESPSQSILDEYLQKNAEKWKEPKKRIAQYFTIYPEDYYKTIKIDEETLLDEFNLRKENYDTKETRSFDQIIFDNEEDALINYEKLKNGTSLKDIELQNTDLKISSVKDINSSQIPKLISQPLFNSELNEIIKPIKSDFGYHLIKVLNITPSIEAKYGEIRDKLKDDLIKEKSLDMIYDLANFVDEAFISGKSMKEVSNLKKFKLYTSGKLSEDQSLNKKIDFNNDLENSPLFLESLWSLNLDENPQLIDNKDDSFFAIKLLREEKPYLPKIEVLKDKLENDWISSKSEELTIKEAKNLIKNPNILEISENRNFNVIIEKNISRNDQSNQFSKTAFKIDEIKEKDLNISDENVQIIILDNISEPSISEVNDFIKNSQSYYDNMIKDEIASSFIASLEAKHTLKVNRSSIIQALGLTR